MEAWLAKFPKGECPSKTTRAICVIFSIKSLCFSAHPLKKSTVINRRSAPLKQNLCFTEIVRAGEMGKKKKKWIALSKRSPSFIWRQLGSIASGSSHGSCGPKRTKATRKTDTRTWKEMYRTFPNGTDSEGCRSPRKGLRSGTPWQGQLLSERSWEVFTEGPASAAVKTSSHWKFQGCGMTPKDKGRYGLYMTWA